MAVTPLRPPKPADGFPITWIHDAVLKLDSRPVVKGLIEQGAFAVIYGPSGSGKSFFTADIAQHIALGAAWRGRKCPQGLVVYVASEAGSSILKRFIGWRDNRVSDGLAKIPLAVLTRGPNLLNTVDIEKICEQLAALQHEAGLPLALVVFDTLSRSIPGGDENSAEDMTMAVNAADYIREKFNAATLYVHHTGKDPEKGARGHSALFAAADLVVRVMDGCATVDKVRDGVAGERFPFTLEPIELGVDADGDPVMTCLLNASETSGPAKRPEPGGKNQRLAIRSIRTLVLEVGKAMPGTSAIPKGVKAIQFDALLAALTPKFAGMPEWRVRQRVTDALLSLQSTSHVGVHNEYIWLI
jgi:putative DNA primase/helicase